MAIDLEEHKIRNSLPLRGKVVCSLDASPLVALFAGVPSFADLRDGIRRIRAIAKSLVLSIEVMHPTYFVSHRIY